MDTVLKEFGLYEYKNRYVEELSGGIKRRIDIIAALLHEPKVIF
ncbi:ATP-binding cassette domain-containing protein [Dorea formicigenerans]|uniref:ATP-binding cassette domain-containing protein n=1 Tax=Dorea formicigenerans TaxID=39486 RepID=A0A415H0K9_9FIRM|nr:ATP-binding cassette domain-containing protein [Dorea formicigenerans]